MTRLSVISGSRVALAQRCLAWVGQPADEDAGDDARFGTAAHDGAEQLARGQTPNVLALGDAHRLAPADVARLGRVLGHVEDWIDSMMLPEVAGGPPALRPEVGLAYDVDADLAVDIPRRGPEGYPGVGARSIPMTVDLLVDGPGGLAVFEWKTGRPKSWHGVQLRTQMLAVARRYGLGSISGSIGYLDEDGIHWSALDERDAFDLADHAAALRFLLDERDAGARAEPVPGVHCTEAYCPRRFSCVAGRRELAIASSTLVSLDSDAQALRAWELLKVAPAALEGLRRDLIERLRRSAVTLPDGSTLGVVEQERRDVDVTTEAHRAALASVLGEHVAVAARQVTRTEATLGSIEEAARALVRARGTRKRGEPTIADVRDAAVQALAAAGGVKTSRYAVPKVFDK